MARDDDRQPANLGAHRRVERMSDTEREDVARKLAGRRDVAPARSILPSPHGLDSAGEAARAEEAARITAELRRTERRLDRLDRFSTKSRYQMGSGSAPAGRYARLERHAERLERKLRSLT
jgi:hypothetical protein